MFFFYNNRKPRKFGYTPILYNPEEEERQGKLNKRIAEIKREMGVLPQEEKTEKTDFKDEFVSQTQHLKKRKDREATGETPFFTNNGLLVAILAILLGIFFFWLLR